MSNRPNRVGTIAAVILSAVLLTITGLVVVNRQYVADAVSAWQYEPSAAIVEISKRTTFTDQGKFYFYASHPAIESAEQFNLHCQQQESGSAILGCYSAGDIYIYDVTNDQLDGIEEVTAAHETLHAVWDRLGDTDKSRLTSLLEAELTRINSPELNERMAYYDRTEPGERANELHSIIGTEFSGLSAELEAHYSTYFKNRSSVVSLHTSYQSVFDNLKKQSDELEKQINALKTSLDSAIAKYNAESAQLSKEIAALKAQESTVDRTSSSQVNAYNAKRQQLLSRIDTLDRSREAINAQTDTYNAKITAYNDLIVRTNNLSKSLDSTLQATPSL